MERYHIYKLGLAILFYAIYCRRPIIVNALKQDNSNNETTTQVIDDYYYVYYQGVEGLPGVDFPILSHIPRTTFTCKDIESGYYADLETDCQVFHICNEGKKVSFLCPNGTIFQQGDLICDWWFKVNCTNSPNLYEESAEQLREDELRRKESRKVLSDDRSKHYNSNEVRAQDRSQSNSYHSDKLQRKDARTQNDPKTPGRSQERKKSRVSGGRTSNLDSSKSGTSNNENVRAYNSRQHSPTKNQRTENGISNNNKHSRTDSNLNRKSHGDSHPKPQKNYESSFREHTSSEESQVPQETASFFKSGYNRIQEKNKKPTSPYPNHRQTYSDLKDPKHYYSTTQAAYSRSTIDGHKTTINDGQPFVSTTPQPFNLDKSTAGVNVVYEKPKVGGKVSTTTEVVTSTVPSNHKPYYEPTTILDLAYTNGQSLGTTTSYGEEVKRTYSNFKNNYQATQSTIKSLSSNFAQSTIKSLSSNFRKIDEGTTAIPLVNDFTLPSTISQEFTTTQAVTSTSPSTNQASSGSGVNKKSDASRTTNVEAVYQTVKQEQQSFNSKGNSKGNSKAITSNSKIIRIQSTTPTNEYGKSIDYSAKYTGGFVSNSLSPFNGKDAPATESTVFRINVGKVDNAGTTSQSSARLGHSTTTSSPDVGVVTGYYINTDADIITTENSVTPTTRSPNTYLPTGTNILGTSNTAFTSDIIGLSTPGPLQGADLENTGKPKISSTPILDQVKFVDVYASTSPKIYKPKPFESSTSRTPDELLNRSDSKNFFSSRNGLEYQSYTKLSEQYSTTTPTPKYEISSAVPFSKSVSQSSFKTIPTEPTPYTKPTAKPSVNVNNMITTLMTILGKDKMRELTDTMEEDTPRPGLIIPPSAGPQTLHTLAVYFANALDDIMLDHMERSEDGAMDEDEIINELLSMNTLNKYKELFDDKKPEEEESVTESVDLLSDHTKNLAESPRVRLLAQTFTKALSSYLENPENFRKSLKDIRPTEPPHSADDNENEKDEVLNFSDGGAKSNLASHFSGFNNVKPTWGFVLATDPKENALNGENENLQNADSQSFVSQLNTLNKEARSTMPTPTPTPTPAKTYSPTRATQEESTTIRVADRFRASETATTTTEGAEQSLPTNHWTSSPDATKLWQTTLQVNPHSINQKLDVHQPVTSSEETTTESSYETDFPLFTTDLPAFTTPSNEVRYELHSLPKLELNETQVHGLLIDFVNTSKSDEKNRLTRILHKLNTTEDEFLVKMQEIEKNPLTRRLILLLISECESGTKHAAIHDIIRLTSADKTDKRETFETASSSDIRAISVGDHKKAEDQDARALELLNSLYTIASRYGK